jgi:hypothetical protein
MLCGKKKKWKNWVLNVKLCYFVAITGKLNQIIDNDTVSGRIRSYFGFKGALSSSGRLEKAVAR